MKDKTPKGASNILFYLIKEKWGWNVFNSSTNCLILSHIGSEKALAFLRANNPEHPAVELLQRELENADLLDGLKENLEASAHGSEQKPSYPKVTQRNFNHYLIGKFNA